MSEVFISYARQDEAKARHVVDALRAAGFQVWRDEQLPTHRAYYEVIEERLRAARAVVVLWSKAAVQSQWVRAEADLARSEGKLVQASVDGEPPPMPFNQIQCAQLKSWHGAPDHHEWAKVVESVTALSASQERPAAKRASGFGRRALPALGVLLAVLLAAGGLYLARDRFGGAPANAGPRIAVLPFETVGRDPEEAEFAAALGDDVAGMLSENDIQILPRSQSAALVSPDRVTALKRVGARYALGGSVRNEEGRLKVRAYLEDVASNVTVWSAQFDRPQAEAGALRDAVAVASTESIDSALEPLAQPGLQLDPQTVALWIKAENATKSPQMLALGTGLRATEQVVAQAPNFAAARAILAINLVGALRTAAPADRASLAGRLRKEAQMGIRLNAATAGASYDALFAAELIEHPLNFPEAETYLLRGIATDPNLPFLPMRECRFLFDVGRRRDSLRYCQNASTLNPLAAPVAYTYARSLAATGQRDLAQQVISRAFRYHPNHMQTRKVRFELEAFEGSPDAALAMLHDPAQRSQLWSEEMVAALELFLTARKTNAAADQQRALTALSDAAGGNPQDLRYPILAATTFGDSDRAFATIDSLLVGGPNTVPPGNDSAFAVLFDPAGAVARRDPRFWRAAQRLGYLGYWRTRGAWPDFCTDPGVHIDCRADAMRATGTK